MLRKRDTIGPDYLNDKIPCSVFLERVKSHQRMNIGNLLMNQSIISGVGNYIKSEILYMARIDPHHSVSEIPDGKLKKLYESMKEVMDVSYANRGMSQENYVDVDGKKGDYVHFLKVYRKKKDPNGRTVTAEKMGGRTTYWVKDWQD